VRNCSIKLKLKEMDEQIEKIIDNNIETDGSGMITGSVYATKEITSHMIKFNMWLLNKTNFALIFAEINEENYLKKYQYWFDNVYKTE
jgi:hypothetical protein